jgi:GNAT superfamily N-acetyltransferase
MSLHFLDNIVWHALTGPHARFAAGDGGARRYAAGFSPIVGFENPESPDFAALARVCSAREAFHCEGWYGSPPSGWRIDFETTLLKMVFEGPMPDADEAPEVVMLNSTHANAALALATVTRPGPFGPRTIELGDYFGVFEDGKLIAMAGERMYAGSMREISGVCTLPEFQGRGLARRLMRKLARQQMSRGETPFLHVIHDNATARSLYQRMGFRVSSESVVRVISQA